MTKPYWRDTASERTQFQLDSLLGEGLVLGERLAKRHGEFFPFAFVWETAKEQPDLITVLDGSPDELAEDHIPDSKEIIVRTLKLLHSRRDDLDGIALVSDLRINGEPAIDVVLEHRDGVNFAIYRSYRQRRMRKGGKLGELGGRKTEPVVFAD